MTPLRVPLAEAREAFLAQSTQLVEVCRDLADLDLLDPSRCRGWSRLDLVVHVRLGLDEMAAGAAARTDAAPDHDAASYWSAHPDDRDDDPVPHVLWLRRTSSAYGRPAAAVRHLADTAARAGAAVRALTERSVPFQGTVMTAGDFVATWVVELAVHQLDLGLPDDAPAPVGAALARRTLEAVAAARLPAGLPDADAVLAGLGRAPWPEHVARPEPFPVSL